jgi:anti-sigma B factor antagonist
LFDNRAPPRKRGFCAAEGHQVRARGVYRVGSPESPTEPPLRDAVTTMLSRSETPSHSQPSATAFGIDRREVEHRTSVIAVTGELDLSTAPRLKWTLVDALEAGIGALIVDLSRVTFIDSTALGVLVGVRRRLDGGERLAVVCAHSEVLQIFELAGMDSAFAIFATLDEALAHVRSHAARCG